MAEAYSIAEYLATLGYRIDEQSQRRFMDAIDSMSKNVLGLSAGLIAAAGAVTAAVSQMAGSGEKMYYIGQRIQDSVSDVDALTFAFSKLGIAPQEALSSIVSMADKLRSNPYIRSLWSSITGSETINSASLQKFSDAFRAQSADVQRVWQQNFAELGPAMFMALRRGGPGAGVGEFNLVKSIFGVDPDGLAKQSVAYENAMRGVALRLDMVGKEVQGAMMPALTSTTLALQEWLDRHAPQIKSGVDIIAAAMGRLPEPVKLALAAITSILPEMEHWNAGSAALAVVIGDKLLPMVFRLTAALTSLVAVRPAAWLLSLLGVPGAVIAGGAVATGYAYEANKADQESILRGGKPTSWLGRLGEAAGERSGVHVTATREELEAAQKQKDALTNAIGGAFHSFRDWFAGASSWPTTSQPSPAQHERTPPAGAAGHPPASTDRQPAAPAQGEQSSLWQRLNELLTWMNPISAAHAEELPQTIKTLTERMSDLNDTLGDLTAQMLVSGMGSLGQNLGEIGAGGGGVAGGGAVPAHGVNLNDPKVVAAVKYMMAKGWPLHQAIGMVANFMSESGLDPNAANASNHVGIAQWDQARQQTFQGLHGKPLRGSSLEDQLDFADWELKHTERKAGDDLSGTSSARDATSSFYKNFERAGADDPSLPRRLATGTALMRNPNITTNNTSGPSVTQTNNVTIHAPGGDPNEIAGALDQANARHWADVSRNLSVPLQ